MNATCHFFREKKLHNTLVFCRADQDLKLVVYEENSKNSLIKETQKFQICKNGSSGKHHLRHSFELLWTCDGRWFTLFRSISSQRGYTAHHYSLTSALQFCRSVSHVVLGSADLVRRVTKELTSPCLFTGPQMMQSSVGYISFLPDGSALPNTT